MPLQALISLDSNNGCCCCARRGCVRGRRRPAGSAGRPQNKIAAPEELLAAQGGITLRSRRLAPARVVRNVATEENADGAAEVSDSADPEVDEPKAKRPRAVRRIAADPYAPECAPAACDDGSASAGTYYMGLRSFNDASASALARMRRPASTYRAAPDRAAAITAAVPTANPTDLVVIVPKDLHSRAKAIRAEAPGGAIDQTGRLLPVNGLVAEAPLAERTRLRLMAQLCAVHFGLRANVVDIDIKVAARRGATELRRMAEMKSPSEYILLQRRAGGT